MFTLFGCHVHRKDVAGSKGRASGQRIRVRSSPEAETLFAFGCAMEATNFPAI